MGTIKDTQAGRVPLALQAWPHRGSLLSDAPQRLRVSLVSTAGPSGSNAPGFWEVRPGIYLPVSTPGSEQYGSGTRVGLANLLFGLTK